jgi:protein-serine/threonine kinase
MFQPLAPANGASPDATRDPLLRHKIHGAEIMDVRKALAFAGFTHKSPRAVEYMRADGAFDNLPSMQHVAKDTVRGRLIVRETRNIGLGRAISM